MIGLKTEVWSGETQLLAGGEDGGTPSPVVAWPGWMVASAAGSRQAQMWASWDERGLAIGTSGRAGLVAEQAVLERPATLARHPRPLRYLIAAALESSQKVFDEKRFRSVIRAFHDRSRDRLIVGRGEAERNGCSQQWR
jgi:hypothetical protein